MPKYNASGNRRNGFFQPTPGKAAGAIIVLALTGLYVNDLIRTNKAKEYVRNLPVHTVSTRTFENRQSLRGKYIIPESSPSDGMVVDYGNDGPVNPWTAHMKYEKNSGKIPNSSRVSQAAREAFMRMNDITDINQIPGGGVCLMYPDIVPDGKMFTGSCPTGKTVGQYLSQLDPAQRN